jgi:hypothetical protein
MISLRDNAFLSFGTACGLLSFGLVNFTINTWQLAIVGNAVFGLVLFYLAWLDKKKLMIFGKEDGELYLTRWHLIRCKWFRVFLHRIYKPDADRACHNHPWPKAFSLILWGGYAEKRLHDARHLQYVEYGVYSPGAFATDAFKQNRYHRIVDVKPRTWTLFFAGRRTRDWGFLVDGQHVPWREYLKLPPDYDFGD